MDHPSGYEPLFSNPKRLLLDMAREKSLAELLQLIVARLSDSPRVALVRIWLAQPTTDCTGCPLLDACRDRSHCLHLAASGEYGACEQCRKPFTSRQLELRPTITRCPVCDMRARRASTVD